jgi:hypothetical protein
VLQKCSMNVGSEGRATPARLADELAKSDRPSREAQEAYLASVRAA